MQTPKTIKCVVWDLDNTIWDGTLLEDKSVAVRREVVDVLKMLDTRGILHSIASKNDRDAAAKEVERLGLEPMFLYPQFGWRSKVESIRSIAQQLSLGLDAFAFVDDDPAEREEVRLAHPEVMCIDAADIGRMPYMPEMMPAVLSPDAGKRRRMYRSEAQRKQAEEKYHCGREAFLATLGMRLTISVAREADLLRAEELTLRTHQLNSTGRTYSYEQLNRFRISSDHRLMMGELTDKFGEYGKIGLLLLELADRIWTIKMLLMSCRVLARGMGSVMLHWIQHQARERGVGLRGEFLPTGSNRMMLVAYRFAGFEEVARTADEGMLLADSGKQPCVPPSYLTIDDSESVRALPEAGST